MAKVNGPGFFVGIVVGSVLGVAATAALGPRLNEHTRRRLHEQGRCWRGRAGVLTTRARANTGILFGQARAALPKQRARLREALAEGKKAAMEKQHELRSKLDQRRHGGDETA